MQYPWLSISNEKDGIVTLRMYGEVTHEKWRDNDISLDEFKEIASIDADTIKVYINGPGGNVFAGIVIGSILKEHKAYIDITVDGIAASIYTTILMAGDIRRIVNNGMLYLHNPVNLAFGYADDLRKVADNLDKVKKSMLSELVDKTGTEESVINSLMNNESFLNAEESLSLGFVDEIIKDKNSKNIKNKDEIIINGVKFNTKNYKNFDHDKIIVAENNEPEPIDYSNIEQAIVENQILLNSMEVLR